MNYEEFCAALQEELFNMLDTGYSIHREHVLKNNGVVLDSLALLKAGKHCSPVISLEMLYEQDILCPSSAITWYRSLIRNFRSPWRV